MNVVITDFAKKRIRRIYRYYKDKGLTKVGQKLRLNIVAKAKLLKKQPYMGTIEENTKNLNKEYRFIVTGNYKIIYTVESPNIYIVEVFDTRQDPNKMKL